MADAAVSPLPPLAILRGMPRETQTEVELVVCTGRKLRGLTLRKNKPHLDETESLRRSLNALYECCFSARVALTVKKIAAYCNQTDEGVADADDSDDAVSPEFEHHWYSIEAEMRTDKNSYNGFPQSCGRVKDDVEKHVCDALVTMSPAKEIVSLRSVSVSYDSVKNVYFVEIRMNTPPTYEQTAASSPPRAAKDTSMRADVLRRSAAVAAASAAPPPAKRNRDGSTHTQFAPPSVEECVKFYGTRPDTWSLFGISLRNLFSAPDDEEVDASAPKRKMRVLY